MEKIAFTVTIYDADVRKQNFGQVDNAYIHIMDDTSHTELVRFDLGEDFSIETAVVVGELYRHSGEWKFQRHRQRLPGRPPRAVSEFRRQRLTRGADGTDEI